MRSAEFDKYASDYQAGMEHPLKRLLGPTRESYLKRKIVWLTTKLRALALERKASLSALHVLEVGCGDGALLRGIREMGFGGTLKGCDVSPEMLAAAIANTSIEDRIEFSIQSQEDALPFGDARFEVVILCAVLHHVPVGLRRNLLADCSRALRADGMLLVIEHNPWNPVTRFVVAGTTIDQHAELLSTLAFRKLITSVGSYTLAVEYMMFVPPRWQALANLEHLAAWLPLGGQYAVACRSRCRTKLVS